MILKEALKIALENEKITDNCEPNQIYNICKELGYEGTEEEFMEEFLNLLQNETDQMNNNELDMVSGGKNNLISRIGACSLSALGAFSMVSSVGAVSPIKRRLPADAAVSLPQVIKKDEIKKLAPVAKSWNFVKNNPKLSVIMALGIPIASVGLSFGGKKLYDHMTYKNAFIDRDVRWQSSLNQGFKEGFKQFDEKINNLKDKKTVSPRAIEDICSMMDWGNNVLDKSGFSYLVGNICPWLKEKLENEVFKKCVKDEQGNLKIDSAKAIKIWNQAKKEMASEVKFAMEHDDRFMRSLGPVVAEVLCISMGDDGITAILDKTPETGEVTRIINTRISVLRSFLNNVEKFEEAVRECVNGCVKIYVNLNKESFETSVRKANKALENLKNKISTLLKEFESVKKEMEDFLSKSDYDGLAATVGGAKQTLKNKEDAISKIQEMCDNAENQVNKVKKEYEKVVEKAEQQTFANNEKARERCHITWFLDQFRQLEDNINNNKKGDDCSNLFKADALKTVLNANGLNEIPSLSNGQFKEIHDKFKSAFTSVAGKYLDQRSVGYGGGYNDDIDVSKFLNNHDDNEKNERKDFLKSLLYYERNVQKVYKPDDKGPKEQDIFVYYPKCVPKGLLDLKGRFYSKTNDYNRPEFHLLYYKELMYYYKDENFNDYINNIDQGNGKIPIAYKMAKKLLLGEVENDEHKGEGKEACKAIGRFINLIAGILSEPFKAEEGNEQAPQEVESTQPTESAPAQPTEQPSDSASVQADEQSSPQTSDN